MLPDGDGAFDEVASSASIPSEVAWANALHDGPIQSVSAALLRLELLARDRPDLRERLDEISDVIRSAVRQMAQLDGDLRAAQRNE